MVDDWITAAAEKTWKNYEDFEKMDEKDCPTSVLSTATDHDCKFLKFN